MRPTLFGTVAGSASSFDPSSIAGLFLWLKADAITGKVDGDAVTAWADSSSAGNNTTSPELTYLTDEVNGNPAVRFTDITNTNKSYAVTPSITAKANWTFFAVVKDVSTADVYNLSAGNDTHALISNYVQGRTEYFSSPRTTVGNNSYFDYRILKCTVGDTATGVWTIGGEITHAEGNECGWLLAELLAYDSDLSAGDITLVEDYLTAKYAIANSSILWCAGDSLTVSYDTNVSDPTQAWPKLLRTALATSAGGTWHLANDTYEIAEVGADLARILQLQQLVMTPRVQYGRTNQICTVWGGTNDIGAGGTAANALTATLSCVNEAYNNGFVLNNGLVPVLNMLPRQDLGAGNAAFEASRTTYNAGLAATVSGKGLVIDVAGIANLSDPNNTTYYLSDKVHLTTAGYALVYDAVFDAISPYVN